jgi:hypothetical protein
MVESRQYLVLQPVSFVPESEQWPDRISARTLDLPPCEAGQRMMQSASPAAFNADVGADKP